MVDRIGMRTYLAIVLRGYTMLGNHSPARSIIAGRFALSSYRSDLCKSLDHPHFDINIFTGVTEAGMKKRGKMDRYYGLKADTICIALSLTQ